MNAPPTMSLHPATRRRIARLEWILFALALLVRLGFLAAELPVPAQDTPDYDEIAHNLLSGHGFLSSSNWYGHVLRSWRAPFYPFFLAAVYAMCGFSHLAVQLIQALLGALTVVLLYRLTLEIRPDAALLAAAVFVFYGPLAAACAEVMTETWYTFWCVTAVLLLWPAATHRDARDTAHGDGLARLLTGGVVLGLAALTRPVGLLLGPALAWSAWRSARFAGLRRALWVALAALCTIAPWTLRNYQVHHALVPIATHGGFIIARSNADAPAWRQHHGWRIAASVLAQTPSEIARDHQWSAQGYAWIRTHPRAYLRLVGERFLRLWYFLRPSYNFWFMLILPLALVGFWSTRNAAEFRLLRCFIGISVCVFSCLLYGSTRFRLPMEPFFILLAATATVQGWHQLGRRRMGVILTIVGSVNLLLYWRQHALREALLTLLDAGGLR